MKHSFLQFLLAGIVFVLISSVVSDSHAQQRYSGLQQLIIQHADELQVTDEQKKQLAELQLNMRQQSRTMVRQQRQQPGRRTYANRGERRQQQRVADGRSNVHQNILDVLTEEQQLELQQIRTRRAQSAYEFRTLRNQLLIEQVGINDDRAGKVLDLMNQQNRLHLQHALERIESGEMQNRSARTELHSQQRKLQDELKQILTAAEYELLFRDHTPRMRAGNRAERQGRFQHRYR